jgi:predicted TIM-barrel fold metal-dependent hydrolase
VAGVERRPPLFDAHLHIVDPRFPLTINDGYLPEPFRVEHYRGRTAHLDIVGGAVVSGSFQAFDQSYLLDALSRLGPGFVGVTQLPADVPDAEVLALAAAGVRGVRFNLRRGGSAAAADLDTLARRVHELADWHIEVYLDSRDLPALAPVLAALPAVSIDHLGLSRDGLPTLLRLVGQGARVKATGFYRGDLDVPATLKQIDAADSRSLMAGTDLPSTRTRPFEDADLDVIRQSIDEAHWPAVFSGNARAFYRIDEHPGGSQDSSTVA